MRANDRLSVHVCERSLAVLCDYDSKTNFHTSNIEMFSYLYTHWQFTQCYTVTYSVSLLLPSPSSPSPFASSPIHTFPPSLRHRIVFVLRAAFSSPSVASRLFRIVRQKIQYLRCLTWNWVAQWTNTIAYVFWGHAPPQRSARRSATSYARLALCAIVSRAHSPLRSNEWQRQQSAQRCMGATRTDNAQTRTHF